MNTMEEVNTLVKDDLTMAIHELVKKRGISKNIPVRVFSAI